MRAENRIHGSDSRVARPMPDGCFSLPGARADRSAAFGVAFPVPGQRSLDGPGVRAHAEVRLDRPGQGGWPQCGVGGQRLLGLGQDLRGELVRPARPGPGRHEPFQSGSGQRGGCLVVRGPGVPERGGGGDRHLVRTISYLTWITSRASKNSPARNAASDTCSGCGFRHRASRSAAAFGSPPGSRLARPPPGMLFREADHAQKFSSPAVVRQYATDISRISSAIEYPRASRAHRPSRTPGIIALTLTA